jgi:L-seryl-tRNA(Ser) seleniumtransferase
MNAALLRYVPSVEKLAQAVAGAGGLPRRVVAAAARAEAERVRAHLLGGGEPEAFTVVADRVRAELEVAGRGALRPVINGTGVVLHTNLGRAPLGAAVATRVAAVAAGYSNLEMDLESGERGRRAPLVDRLLAVLTGAEAVCVVNNCAAAVVLVLRHLCAGERKEVIISRGELVEIGGGFRVPDIIETSGARLREIGTTNKTTVADYERALSPQTAAILRVHRSNFYQEGFTASPESEALAALARRAGVPLVEDLGSGAVVDTASLATLEHEPTVTESLVSGADLVCVSGDKLFGGPQAGIIAGTAAWVGRVRQDPFFRVLRCDKLMLAALQETALAYLAATGDAPPAVPVVGLLSAAHDGLLARADALVDALGPVAAVGQGTSRCGGGTMPRSAVASITLDLSPRHGSVDDLARRLRLGRPPVIGYIAEGKLKLDLRTVFPEQDEALLAAVRAALEA